MEEDDACNVKFVKDSVEAFKKSLVHGAGGLILETSSGDTTVVNAVADTIKNEFRAVVDVTDDCNK